MSDALTLWLTMIACGALTFGTRLAFIALEGRFSPPRWFRLALPFVPIAALTAITVPEVIPTGIGLGFLQTPRFWAAVVAVGVAWKWRRIELTIAVGFIALLLGESVKSAL